MVIATRTVVDGVEVLALVPTEFAEILTPEMLNFIIEEGARQPPRADPGDHRVHQPRGQALHPEQPNRHAQGAPPGLALARETGRDRRPVRLRLPVRLRPLTVPELESWLPGSGCVPIFNLMVDAATREIVRAQIWQWINHSRSVLEDDLKVTTERFRAVVAEALKKLRAALGPDAFDPDKFDLVRTVFDNLATREPLVDFLTLPAYERLS